MRLTIPLLVLSLALTSAVAQAFPTYATGGFRGADLMTADEIKAHIGQLMSVKTLIECEGYMAGHEQELQKRAAARQVVLPAKPGNPCEVMRKLGRIQ